MNLSFYLLLSPHIILIDNKQQMEYIDVNLPKFKKKTEKFKPNYRTF